MQPPETFTSPSGLPKRGPSRARARELPYNGDMVLSILAATAALAVQDVQGLSAQFRGVWISGDGIVATLCPTLAMPAADRRGSAFLELRKANNLQTLNKGSSWIFCKGERVYASGPNKLVPEGSYMAPWLNTAETQNWREWKGAPDKFGAYWGVTKALKAVETGLLWIGFGPARSDGSIDRLKVKMLNERGNPVLGVRDQDWWWAGGPGLIDMTGSWKSRDAKIAIQDAPGDWVSDLSGTLESLNRRFAVRGHRAGPFAQIEVLHPATGAVVGFATLVWDPQASDLPALKSGQASVSRLRAFVYLVDNTWPTGYTDFLAKG